MPPAPRWALPGTALPVRGVTVKRLCLIFLGAAAIVLAVVGIAAAKTVYWVNYGEGPKTEPRKVYVYRDWISGTKHWRHWGAHRTRARGRIHYNTCKPDCASGHYEGTPGAIALSRVHKCGPRLQYRKAHVKFKKKPKRWDFTLRFNCDGSLDF